MEHVDWHKFFADHIRPKYELYTLISNRIMFSIHDKSTECILFDVDSEPYITIVDQSEFIDILEHCFNYFVKNEDYEICGMIKDSIEEHEFILCIER